MNQPHAASSSLVSVIIPCYNHGQYLSDAIKSVQVQTHREVEIVVVDDGSTDNTATVAAMHPAVVYIFQENQGLSAARNTGIQHSKGDFLVFLDADDWLYPEALAQNIHCLRQNRQAAFSSGAYRVIEEGGATKEMVVTAPGEPYLHLLRSNYIAMVATVMFRRWVFDDLRFDVSLRACEDYDLYLEVARIHPIIHHGNMTAGYRIYASNMSSNIPLMLTSSLKVLQRQESKLKNANERLAYKEGLRFWKSYYIQLLYVRLRMGKEPPSRNLLLLLLKYHPLLLMKFLLAGCFRSFSNAANKRLGEPAGR